jgi:hypothetical protein
VTKFCIASSSRDLAVADISPRDRTSPMRDEQDPAGPTRPWGGSVCSPFELEDLIAHRIIG